MIGDGASVETAVDTIIAEGKTGGDQRKAVGADQISPMTATVVKHEVAPHHLTLLKPKGEEAG